MPVRIEKTSAGNETILKVDGRLVSEDVGELARAFRSVEGTTTLDLSDLLSADRPGVEILQEIISLGAEVRGASPYIELLLKTKP